MGNAASKDPKGGQDARTGSGDEVPKVPPGISRTLAVSENVIYTVVSVVLFAGASVLLVQSSWELATKASDGAANAVREMLDTLLLVFILVELLAAVRETMEERRIVAEPFLLIGIIASIKEVVVLAIGAKEDLGKRPDAFEDAMIGIGTLSVLLLVLAVATLLVRRKEREPEE